MLPSRGKRTPEMDTNVKDSTPGFNRFGFALAGLCLILLGCGGSAASSDGGVADLQLLSTVHLDVAEPSGLTPFGTGQCLVIGDSTGRMDVLSLDGQVVRTMETGLTGMEAVTYRASDDTIWVVQEEARVVSKLDSTGHVLAQYDVNVAGPANKGPEGLAWHPGLGVFFMLKEGSPGTLYRWDPAQGILSARELAFALDYSDIYCDPDGTSLWIVSDESRTLTRTDLDGVAQQTWSHGLPKVEGVIVDRANGRVYLTSDSVGDFYVLKF